jgi:hypothetical protein
VQASRSRRSQAKHFSHQRIGCREGRIDRAGAIEQSFGIDASLAKGHERFDGILFGSGTSLDVGAGHVGVGGGEFGNLAGQFRYQQLGGALPDLG